MTFSLSKFLFFIQFNRDSTSNKFPLYASGRENLHYAHFNLELKNRQDFVTMFVSLIMCRSLFRSPISKDSLWIELPIDRGLSSTGGESDLVSEILIVQKKGYYLE
jgi:hypothetical protein